MQFWFVNNILKYVNCATPPKDLLVNLMLQLFPTSCCQEWNRYLLLSACTAVPLSLPVTYKAYMSSCIVITFLPNKLLWPVSTRSSYDPFIAYQQLQWPNECQRDPLTLSNPIFLPPAYSPALIYFGLERGWWITCLYYTRKSVGQALTAEQENKRNKKTCRTSSDIGAEQENHNVGQGPTLDRKGLSINKKPL
jgi:hypothetical protein